MTLPTFLGIGAPRCGTTWLHTLLAGHPQVYVPTRRKEVRFFDQYYARGQAWYERFFPDDGQAARYRAIGEITPGYLYCPQCPERMAQLGSVHKLLLIVRNPVDRAYSRYGIDVRYRNFRGTFEDFCAQKPYGIEEGFYSRGLHGYFRYFAREQLLALIYETAVADVPGTLAALARHLEIEPALFQAAAGTGRVHGSYTPTRARPFYAIGIALSRRFRDWDVDWPNRLAKKLRLRRLFGQSGQLPPLTAATRQHLQELYAGEVRELESLLELDLGLWRQA